MRQADHLSFALNHSGLRVMARTIMLQVEGDAHRAAEKARAEIHQATFNAIRCTFLREGIYTSSMAIVRAMEDYHLGRRP